MAAAKSKKVWIYHEIQESLLCGQHCLNNLLQGPHFTAPDLATIAEELDNDERRHMLEVGADTPDAVKFLAEESGNVDDSGNFSLQVLSTALDRSHNVELISWSSSEASLAVRDPTQENGFIINKSNHWFAIRKIDGIWWNLNSTQEAPVQISDFYLTAFLSQLRADKFLVFIAQGTLPTYGQDIGPEQGGIGNWHLASTLLAGGSNKTGSHPHEMSKFTGVGRRLGGEPARTSDINNLTAEELGLALGEDLDPELEAAIRLSLINTEEMKAKDASTNTPPMSKKDEMRAMRLAAADKRAHALSQPPK